MSQIYAILQNDLGKLWPTLNNSKREMQIKLRTLMLVFLSIPIPFFLSIAFF